jgi:hypothetical protein
MKRLWVAVLALAFLAACSSGNQPAGEVKPVAKPAPKPAETVTGREAMQKLFVAARGWAPDAKPVRIESTSTADADGHDGKSAIWRGYFASPARRGMKPYVWSGTGESKERGVNPGAEDSWNPSNTSTQAFDFAYLKIDSDKAFSVAQQHGGEKLLKANPKQEVQYALDWNPRISKLVWHVIYGPNVNDAKLRVAVDATEGIFMRVEK